MSGLYVASNVNAIGAQLSLSRTGNALSGVLARLTTGLRINSGKDDPAGLIASSLLKSEISASQQAIKNTQRANSMVAVADSALAQVGSLLNDIRVLVNEAANTGALNDDQLAANQLQVDASIDSIDRIARVTTFQGQRLLDGSLDFRTAGVDKNALKNLDIQTANFGTMDSIDVSIKVFENAERAQLIFNQAGISEPAVIEIGGRRGSQVFNFAEQTTVQSMADAINRISDSTGVRAVVGAEATNGQLLATSVGLNNDIVITAKDAGAAAGNWAVKFTAGTSEGISYTLSNPSGNNTGVIDIHLQTEGVKSASVTRLSPAANGVFSKAFFWNGTDDTLGTIALTSTEGVNITGVEIIKATTAGTGVAVDLDANGILRVEMNLGATGVNVINAINSSIGGVTAIGTANLTAANATQATARAYNATFDATVTGIEPDVTTYSTTATFGNLAAAPTAGLTLTQHGLTSVQTSFPVKSIQYVDSGPIGAVTPPTAVFDGTTGVLTISAYTSGVGQNTWGQIQTAAVTALNAVLGPGTVVSGSSIATGGIGLGIVAAGNVTTPQITALNTRSNTPVNTFTTNLASIVTVAAAIVPAGNNAMDIVALTPGASANNTSIIYIADTTLAPTEVQFNYTQTAQKSTATFLLPGLTDTVYKLQATVDGAALNNTVVKIESDDTMSGVVALWNADANELHIRANLDGLAGTTPTLGQLQAAIANASPFTLTATDVATGQTKLSSTVLSGLITSGTTFTTKTGQTASDMGTDGPALMIRMGVNHTTGATATAANLLTAYNRAANTQIRSLFSITNSAGSNGSGALMNISPFNVPAGGQVVEYFNGILQGGQDGPNVITTANQLVEFINNDAALSKLVGAALSQNNITGFNNGNGIVSVFEEFADYGDVNLQNALQFLGPKNSAPIEFVGGVANQELGVRFVGDLKSSPSVSFQATNANASMVITSLLPGSELVDTAIRFVRMNNTFTPADNYATYESGESNAMAYCSINATNTNTNTELGKFILYANAKGELYNNASVVIEMDTNQSEDAVARYDENTKELIVTINNNLTTLSQAMDAINNEGTFRADFDYSYNGNPNSSPGISDFSNLYANTNITGVLSRKTVGNTGVTGGHTGGVLTVYMAGNDTQITAQAAINAINNSPGTKGLFMASNFPGSTGLGTISFREDTIATSTGTCGNLITDAKAVTRYSDESLATTAGTVMQILLKTDTNGNSITTARDLAAFFETLTPEQTRGVSVSLVRPDGVPNNLDLFCIDEWGQGLIVPTGTMVCDTFVPDLVYFQSANTEILAGMATGEMVALNGSNASFQVVAKQQGPEYNGVKLQYDIGGTVPLNTAVYDAETKTITVGVQLGQTRAVEVAAAIANSAETKDLFSITQHGTGGGVVSLYDRSLLTKGGEYLSGTRGGANLLGASDADPHKLIIESVDEGTRAFVSLKVISGNFPVSNAQGFATLYSTGKDALVSVNGNHTVSDGRNISLNTPLLALKATLGENVQAGDEINFAITGGGATFQLGPDVVSAQQYRMGIKSFNSATLGGASGALYKLRSGEAGSLTNDTALADRIVQEAISYVASVRGRLGAIQRSVFEPNIAVLQDTLEQLSAGEALISNADFALESSSLARLQVLMQSGAKALGIANQMPQYAAMLVG